MDAKYKSKDPNTDFLKEFEQVINAPDPCSYTDISHVRANFKGLLGHRPYVDPDQGSISLINVMREGLGDDFDFEPGERELYERAKVYDDNLTRILDSKEIRTELAVEVEMLVDALKEITVECERYIVARIEKELSVDDFGWDAATIKDALAVFNEKFGYAPVNYGLESSFKREEHLIYFLENSGYDGSEMQIAREADSQKRIDYFKEHGVLHEHGTSPITGFIDGAIFGFANELERLCFDEIKRRLLTQADPELVKLKTLRQESLDSLVLIKDTVVSTVEQIEESGLTIAKVSISSEFQDLIDKDGLWSPATIQGMTGLFDLRDTPGLDLERAELDSVDLKDLVWDYSTSQARAAIQIRAADADGSVRVFEVSVKAPELVNVALVQSLNADGEYVENSLDDKLLGQLKKMVISEQRTDNTKQSNASEMPDMGCN